jgi:hypothetical protein
VIKMATHPVTSLNLEAQARTVNLPGDEQRTSKIGSASAVAADYRKRTARAAGHSKEGGRQDAL